MKSGQSKVNLSGQVINGKFLVRKHLGSGSFGDVYEAEDFTTQKIVALKFENGTASNPQLPLEYKCYQILQGSTNIPKVYGLYDYQKSRFLVMDKLGPSLETLFKKCGKSFSLKTVLMIADQMFRTIEYIHKSGLIHRDIKPQNFVIGRGNLRNRIFLIDFGISHYYIDPRTKEHIMFSTNNGLVGTAHYVSINTHLGDQQSRRDDLESIMYVLIRFLQGSLPWQKYKNKNVEQRNEKITQMKLKTDPSVLCHDLPKEFVTLLEYVRHLRYDEEPKYWWIRQQFSNIFRNQGFVYDWLFDWDEAAAIHKPFPADYLIHSANSFLRQNERQVRLRKDRVILPQPRNIFLSAMRN